MIRVQDLTKRYRHVHAVDGVSFRVERGEVVGFLGPNGAGKSTTMRILVGFLQPDAGEVEIAGQRVTPERPASRRDVGYLPENTPLYRRMRVADYLDFVGRIRGLGRGARRDAVERVLTDADLQGWGARRIAELSRGYRQRVGLAQALLSDPAVLVLDEPTSGLDPAEITRIRALIARLGETKTILLSTHVLSEVQETCRRVIILANGRIVADGTPLDLAGNDEVELRVTLRAPGADAELALAEVDGVTAVRALGTDDDGRIGLALAVADRFGAAREVARVAAARDWDLLELRHELSSLEQVFLRVTDPAASAPESADEGEGA